MGPMANADCNGGCGARRGCGPAMRHTVLLQGAGVARHSRNLVYEPLALAAPLGARVKSKHVSTGLGALLCM